MKRTFIYTDDKSNKFWTIEVTGNSYTVNYGKVGTAGQTQTKDFNDEAACQKAADKLIAEKTKKGYIEGEPGEAAAKPAGTTASSLKIPKYKAPEDIEPPYFVVDITNPASIGSVLKHHLADFEEYMELIADDMLDYGTIDEDGEFTPLEGNSDYSEEIFYNAAATFPELWDLLEKYAKKAIAASKDETASGPWSTEETIVGQFAIPALAMQDRKYVPLLLKFMAANVEIKFSSNFQQQFNEILKEVRKKYDMPAEGEKEPEDRELTLLKKHLKNYKDCKSLFTLQKKWGYHSSTDNVFPKLMIAVKEELEKKKPMPLDKIIEHAYHVLDALSSRIPLKRLTDVINDIVAGGALPADDSIVHEKHNWDFWEMPNPVGGKEKSDIQTFSVHFNKKEELEVILKQFVNQFDQYLLVWRYSFFPDNFAITDLSARENSSGRYHNRESDFFLAVAKFPELAPLVTQYVEKLTAEHRKSVLLQNPSEIINVRGTAAAAAMVILDNTTDGKLLAYLDSIPDEYLNAQYSSVYRLIEVFWEKLGIAKPDLPETYATHPKLKK